MSSTRPCEHIDIVNGKRRRTRIDVIAVVGNDVLASFIKSSQMFDLPGGGMDNGESPEQSAIRECMEEAGWECSHPTIFKTTQPNLFIGEDDRWYHQEGWDEELQIPLICTAMRYAPDHRYSREGDGRVFAPVPIPDLIHSYQRELDRDDIRSRRRMQDRIRIEVLQSILEKQNRFPVFSKW